MCVCVCRCCLHLADAAGQSELLHQPLDLLRLLQQRLPGAPAAAALSRTHAAPRLLTERLNHHTHLRLLNNIHQKNTVNNTVTATTRHDVPLKIQN